MVASNRRLQFSLFDADETGSDYGRGLNEDEFALKTSELMGPRSTTQPVPARVGPQNVPFGQIVVNLNETNATKYLSIDMVLQTDAANE